MIVIDISFPNALENILYDQTLLDLAEDGASGEILRFWESEEFFIVLGRISKFEDDVKIEAAKKDNIEIIRRPSGGGTILQGPGCLNYSLILSHNKNSSLRNIKQSYEVILNNICNSLRRLHIDTEFVPISDMVLYGKKFSGNAQVRRRRYILHHGTILYDFPIDIMERYLNIPKNEPPYRKGRSHSDFLINIDIDPYIIKHAITSAFIDDISEIHNTSPYIDLQE
jgi:lipoate-protein ligase A